MITGTFFHIFLETSVFFVFFLSFVSYMPFGYQTLSFPSQKSHLPFFAILIYVPIPTSSLPVPTECSLLHDSHPFLHPHL